MKKYVSKILFAFIYISLFVTACSNREEFIKEEFIKKMQEDAIKSQQEMLEKARHNPDVTWNQYVAMSNMLSGLNYDKELEMYKSQHYGDMQKLPKYIRLGFNPDLICEGIFPNFREAQNIKLGGPYEALDKAAEEYIKAVEDFKPILLKLSRYINSKEYIDDNGKLLKESDAEFIRLAENYVNAVSNFIKAQIAANKIKTKEKIDTLKEAGEVREVAALEVYVAMSEFFEFVANNNEINEQFRSDLDKSIANIKAKIDSFEETNSKISDNVSSQYESLVGQAANTLGSIREYKQLINEYEKLQMEIKSGVKDVGVVDESQAGNKKNNKQQERIIKRKREMERDVNMTRLSHVADKLDSEVRDIRREYERYVTQLNASMARIRR